MHHDIQQAIIQIAESSHFQSIKTAYKPSKNRALRTLCSIFPVVYYF